jgi:hypothetical protein
LAIIVYVACEMIYRGAHELVPAIGATGLRFSWEGLLEKANGSEKCDMEQIW